MAKSGRTTSIDSADTVVQVLRATLAILESASYSAADSKAVVNLKKCLRKAIAEIDIGMH